jgi:general secretion pathway protein D
MSNSDGKSTVITNHEKTNSIIISSDESNITTLKNLISKLDIRRAQVLVEAIVVELSENAANDLGVETVFSGGSDNGEIPIGITRFNDSGPDLLSIVGSTTDSTDTTLAASSLTSLLNTQGIVAGFGDLTPGGNSFAAIINAIARDTNSNILSTPSILAMDNETASSIIGQEIPITTGESLGSNNANPFRTTSRQEVGIKLDVTPQINEGSSVLLEIKIEVSGVAGVVSSGVDLITNKRAIETTALVDDGQIIVLGGLIDDDTQETISKVPLLGSIPIFGKLFQSKSKNTVKKNLMIFIKPQIMTDSNSAYDISSEKYNYIKAQQILSKEQKILEELANPNN